MGDREGMNGVANQPLEGISKIVRVTRTPSGVVALTIALTLILAFGVLPFAPISDIARYVAWGFLALFTLLVWLQFWAKAKTGPLTASEGYYIAELKYRYLGADNARLQAEQDESLPRVQTEEFLRENQTDDDEKGGSQP